jgi:hypothetical protein
MTDQTKLLAGKALDKAVPYTWTKLDYDQIHELLACHAELIVEECAKRAEVYAYMSPNFNALAEELRRMIGVEK